jgi:prophage regulatory protein
MVQKFLRLAEVLEMTGLSKPTIYRLGAMGRFPRPVKLDERASGWLENEVERWQEARIAKRDSEPAPKGRHAA